MVNIFIKKTMEASLLQKLKNHFNSYTSLTPNELHVTNLNSTINTLYKVESKVLPSPVIIREFGESPLVPPELERRNFAMVSRAGLGPRSLAQTDSYRIEEFIPGRPILRSQLEEIAEQVVPTLSAFHSISSEQCEPVTLSLIRRWKLMLETQSQIYLSCVDASSQAILEEILSTISDEREIRSLMPRSSDLAFLHGDFYYGNIIYGKQKYWLVDYEYSEMGHPSIDLANFIVDGMFEYSNSQFLYFPEEELSPSVQVDFVENYANAKKIDSEDLWTDVCRAKAIVNYTKMLWAACSYTPGNSKVLNYANIRLQLYNRYKETN